MLTVRAAGTAPTEPLSFIILLPLFPHLLEKQLTKRHRVLAEPGVFLTQGKDALPASPSSVLCGDKHGFVQPFVCSPDPRIPLPAAEGVQPLGARVTSQGLVWGPGLVALLAGIQGAARGRD